MSAPSESAFPAFQPWVLGQRAENSEAVTLEGDGAASSSSVISTYPAGQGHLRKRRRLENIPDVVTTWEQVLELVHKKLALQYKLSTETLETIKQLEEEKSELENANAEKQRLETVIRGLQESVTQSNSAADSLRQEIAELRILATSAQTSNEELHQQLRQVEDARTALDTSQSELQLQLDEAKTDLDAAEFATNTLLGLISNLMIPYRDYINSFESEDQHPEIYYDIAEALEEERTIDTTLSRGRG
mgnify:CR=1 FL=1